MLIADKINDILPQTQCRQCGFSGCRPYAEAIAQGDADINQCPPGGAAGIANIANLLGCAPKPLNTSHGKTKPKMLAVIDESTCIGCTLCIEACPVDAILGATQQMHTVISDECTGCELCIAPCPVDCISMAPLSPCRDAQVSPEGRSNASSVRDTRPSMDSAGCRERPHYKVPEATPEQIQQKAFAARARYEARLQRLERDKAERAARHQQKKVALTKNRSLP